MIARRNTRMARAAAVIGVAAVHCGCGAVEYHGFDSNVDAVLARQILRLEDPINFYVSSGQDPTGYVAGLGVAQWDGSETDTDLDNGAIVLSNVATTQSAATFTVFISSGPRSDVPTDDGKRYEGPSQVYTCYEIAAQVNATDLTVHRNLLTDCPESLVKQLPNDAAFASGEVFDG